MVDTNPNFKDTFCENWVTRNLIETAIYDFESVKKDGAWDYEAYTTGLWNNIIDYYFRINGTEKNGIKGWCLTHEFYLKPNRADIVLHHIYRDKKDEKIKRVPMLLVECKGSSSSKTANETSEREAVEQLRIGMEYVIGNARNQNFGQPLWGIAATGTKVSFHKAGPKGEIKLQESSMDLVRNDHKRFVHGRMEAIRDDYVKWWDKRGTMDGA